MTILLKQLFQFLKLLNSDTGTNQISSGLALGLFLGFAPFLSLQTFLVLLLVFIFRIQLGAAFISAFFFKFIAYILDPAADQLGRTVLESEALRPLFVTMYNVPLLPLTRFNNSIVMGSMVIALILVIPAFFVFKKLVIQYRLQVVSRFKQTKFWKAFSATTIYQWYCKYDNLYNV